MLLLLVCALAACASGLRFDDLYGDAGRVLFAGKRFVAAFDTWGNGSAVVAVSSNGTSVEWHKIRGEALASYGSWAVDKPVLGSCHSARFAATVGPSFVLVHELASGALVHEGPHDMAFRACAFVSESRLVVVGAEGGNASVATFVAAGVREWKMRTDQVNGGVGIVLTAVAVKGDDSLVVVGSRDGAGLAFGTLHADTSLHRWNSRMPAQMESAADVAVLQDGTVVIVGKATTGGFVYVMRGATGTVHVDVRVNTYRSVLPLPQDRFIAVGDRDNRMVVAQFNAANAEVPETFLWRAFGAKSDPVFGTQVLLDEALHVIAVGNVAYDNAQTEGVVLRLLGDGIHGCEVGPRCFCNGTDCVARGFDTLVLESLDLQSRRLFAEMDVEFTRAAQIKMVQPGGQLVGRRAVLLDGYLALQMPHTGRFPVAEGALVTGRFTTISVNVTDAGPLGECLEYEATQVLSKTQLIVSVSVVKATKCSAGMEAQSMPKSIVAALIILAMFFCGVGAVIVAQIVWRRRVEGGRTLRSTKTKSVAQSAKDHSRYENLGVPLMEVT